MVLTWVMVIFWNTCNYLHLYIYPEGQIEYPLELVSFLERTLLLLLPGITKKPCGLFLDYTHTHTHTHACTSHIHTRECHTHVRHMQTYVTHTNTSHTHTLMSHIYTLCHGNTCEHTHVPRHMSTSTMTHTPFTSCLSGPFAYVGMLTSFSDGSTAINKRHRSSWLKVYHLTIVECASWALRTFRRLCNQQQHPSLSTFYLVELKLCTQ